MKNNNKAIVGKLTSRSMKANQRRNFFVVTAILLTTLLITFVFSVGVSLLDSFKLRQVRVAGTAAHAMVSRPSSEEWERLKGLDYVETVGTDVRVATVNKTPQTMDVDLTLVSYDKAQWEEVKKPAYATIVGRYPEKENEVMVPTWVLEKMGVSPKIGMTIPLSYSIGTNGGGETYEEDFVLSGWFDGYNHLSSGNVGELPVSEAFLHKHGQSMETDGTANIIFSVGSREKIFDYCERMEGDLGITETERVRPLLSYDAISASDRMSTFIGLILIAVFLVFTGYLLIYNVLYISVAREVRFYGLLKTIGTTPRQIRAMVRGQVLRLCAWGIPIGMALALLLSLGLVPYAITTISGDATGSTVSFSPLIYAGAAVFALLTALLGARKPARTAARVSPIEAQKYAGERLRKKKVHSPAHGKLYRMALRNIFRDRKRAAVVLLSLFLGMTVFLVVTTLVGSMDVDNFIASYIDADVVLENQSYREDEEEQKFDDAFLEDVRNVPGFESLQYDTRDYYNLTFTDEFDAYLEGLRERTPEFAQTEEDIEAVKKDFTGIAIGVDGGALSELDGDFDEEAFKRGEYLLIAAKDASHIDASLLEGVESMEIASSSRPNDKVKIPVGGLISFHFHNNSSMVAPTIIISNELMEKLTGGAMRSKLYIEAEKDGDKAFVDQIKAITEGDYEISRTSKPEWREEMRDAKTMLYILGGGVALVLGLIGLLNFVNVMSVSVTVRKREFAALESIGMSRRQMQRMLLCEGVGYALISLVLILFVGNAMAYGFFQLFQQEADYAVFTYPMVPVVTICAMMVLVCVVTPRLAYRSVSKASLVERIRDME